MEHQHASNTPPPIEEVLLEPADASLKKIRKSSRWNLLLFILSMTLMATNIARDNKAFKIEQKFVEVFHAIKLGDVYRNDLFYSHPVVLTASRGSFDQVVVYYDRQQLAILGLKANIIVSCFMACHRWGDSIRVDDTVLADGHSPAYDPAKLKELSPASCNRLLELFLFVFNNDAAVKANMNASTQKGFAIARGEIYLFLLTQLKMNPAIQINKYHDL